MSLSDHGGVHARAVILATGASYRRLGVPELEAMNGAGVFYGGPASEAPGMAGQRRSTSWAGRTRPARRRFTSRASHDG